MPNLTKTVEDVNNIIDQIEGSGEGLEIFGECPILLDDTVWEDKAYSLAGRRLSANAGSVDNDWDEMAVKFQNNGDITSINDLVGISSEKPHSADENGMWYPHMHFWQTSNDPIVFTAEYRIQDNGVAKTETWTRMTAEVATDFVFTYPGGTFGQIVNFHQITSGRPQGIDMTGSSLSATIQFRLTRTDTETGDILATFFDFHYPVKRLGSRLPGEL